MNFVLISGRLTWMNVRCVTCIRAWACSPDLAYSIDISVTIRPMSVSNVVPGLLSVLIFMISFRDAGSQKIRFNDLYRHRMPSFIDSVFLYWWLVLMRIWKLDDLTLSDGGLETTWERGVEEKFSFIER